ncbi:MAG: GumC family protein [Propylenella sp.]
MNEAPRPLRVARMAPPRADARRFDIRGNVAFLRRHIRTITVTMIGLMAITLLIVLQLERRYTATALVVVDAAESRLLGFEPAISNVFGFNAVVDTEVEIARSPSVLGRVAQDQELIQSGGLLPRPSLIDRISWMSGLAEKPETTEGAATWAGLSAEDRARLLESLSGRFKIRRLGLTKVISISAEAESPELAAQLANALTDAYADAQIESKLNSSQKAASFLHERVDVLAAEITGSEEEIERSVATALAQHGTPESRELLRRLDEERATLAREGQALKDIDDALRAEDFHRLSSLLSDTDRNFAARREKLSPTANAADAGPAEGSEEDLAALDQEIRAVAEMRAADLRAAVSSAERNTTAIRDHLSAVLTQQDLPREVSGELFRLQQDAESQKALYANLMNKLREAEQQAVFDLPDSRVVSAATPPDRPSFPPLRLIGGAALLLSGFAGIGMAVLRERYVGGFTSIEQLEAAAGLPAIASIPLARRKDGKPVESTIVSDPLAAFSEAIRRARLGVEAFAKEAQPLCVFVTSTLPEEGKTTIALALARAFALTGRKTLLIDADLRHPSIGKSTGIDPKFSLIEFLRGNIDEKDIAKLVTAPESRTDLSLILAAEGWSGPTDVLLMSDRFRSLMSFARSNFDVVVLDTSPVGLVVDPQIVARSADVGIYVVGYASTNQSSARMAMRQVRSELSTLCLVLNRVAPSGQRGDYGYYH